MTTSEILDAYQLPGDWQRIRLRWLSKRYAGGTPDTKNAAYWEEGTIPWLNSGSVNQSTITEPSAYITELALKESSAKWIPKGALVMALAGQGKTKATVGYLEIDTTGNQSLAAIVPQKIDGKYLYWWLTSQYLTLRNLSSQDGRDGLNLEMIGSIACPVPPLETQRRIARFLDGKTARIDGLIEKKRALLDRLAEKRQALITRAVTKGLNPNVPLKDSGIDWLGEIPAHWEVRRLKQMVSIWGRIGFRGYTVADIVDEGEGALSLSPSNIVDGGISYAARTYVSWEKYHESPEIKVAEGDLLFVKTGSTIGKACYVKELIEPMTINPQLVVLKPIQGLQQFIGYAMRSNFFQHQVAGQIFGGSTPAMTQQNLGSLSLLVPSENEQRDICSFLEECEELYQAEKTLIESSIGKLNEYRSAQITAAVTGKITELQ